MEILAYFLAEETNEDITDEQLYEGARSLREELMAKGEGCRQVYHLLE